MNTATLGCLILLFKNSICWTSTTLRTENLSRKHIVPSMRMVAQIGSKYDFSTASENDGEFDRYYETDVVMQFSGNSLANADRVEHVAQLVKDQLKTGYRPRATVCSAIGKNTNSILLNAGKSAFEGRGCGSIDAVRSLFKATMVIYNLPDQTRDEVNELFDKCEALLSEMEEMSNQMMAESTKSSLLEQLIGYSELCSAHIVAARLNQIGVPALALDTFIEIDPSVVAVVAGPSRKISSSLGIHEIQVFNDMV